MLSPPFRRISIYIHHSYPTPFQSTSVSINPISLSETVCGPFRSISTTSIRHRFNQHQIPLSDPAIFCHPMSHHQHRSYLCFPPLLISPLFQMFSLAGGSFSVGLQDEVFLVRHLIRTARPSVLDASVWPAASRSASLTSECRSGIALPIR